MKNGRGSLYLDKRLPKTLSVQKVAKSPKVLRLMHLQTSMPLAWFKKGNRIDKAPVRANKKGNNLPEKMMVMVMTLTRVTLMRIL